MDLKEVLDVELIDLQVNAKTKDEVISKLADKLNDCGKLVDKEGFIKAVYERESVGETGMGGGIAIPHGLTDCVKKASVAICKTTSDVPWESLDDQPVNLVFMLAMPTDNLQNTHLRMLAQLAAVLAHADHVEALRNCETKEAFYQTFKSYFDERVNQ